MSGESNDTNADRRTPNPPFGYVCECEHTQEQQIRIVAEFFANRIKPARIAYRTGIDVQFVKQLIDGKLYPQHFKQLLAYYRRNRRTQRLNASMKYSGSQRFELQKQIEAEYVANREPDEPKPRVIKTLHRR